MKYHVDESKLNDAEALSAISWCLYGDFPTLLKAKQYVEKEIDRRIKNLREMQNDIKYLVSANLEKCDEHRQI